MPIDTLYGAVIAALVIGTIGFMVLAFFAGPDDEPDDHQEVAQEATTDNGQATVSTNTVIVDRDRIRDLTGATMKTDLLVLEDEQATIEITADDGQVRVEERNHH